jgi:hypothetical protein
MHAQSSSADVQRVCVLVHAVAVAMTARTERLPFASLFATVLYRPAALADTFLPQMPKSDLYNAMVTVTQSGRRMRWLFCRRGHPYTLDCCGAPCQVSNCSECGVLIGGYQNERLEYVGEWNLGVRTPDGSRCDAGAQPPGPVECDRDVDPKLQGNIAIHATSSNRSRKTSTPSAATACHGLMRQLRRPRTWRLDFLYLPTACSSFSCTP